MGPRSRRNASAAGLVAPRVREIQAERSRLEAAAGVHDQWRRLSPREIAEWADSLGGVVQVLKQADPEDRAALYAELGLTLRYDPTRHQIKATAELSRVARGVGGPTRNLGPRPLEADSGWSELCRIA